MGSARGVNGPIGPTGILYRKYTTMRQPLFELGRIKKNTKTKNTDSSTTTKETTDDMTSMIEWLKHSNEPLDQILDYWKKTYKHRSSYNNLSINDYLNTFISLKLPQGYLLVIIKRT